MIVEEQATGRRIYGSPAVRMRATDDPEKLLGCLIDLAHRICQDSDHLVFLTQECSVRRIGQFFSTLLSFLEGLEGEEEMVFQEQVVGSFFRLHFIFQEIQYLIEECSREETAVWMLSKVQFVNGLFNLLIHDIGNAVQLFPFQTIDTRSVHWEKLGIWIHEEAREAKYDLGQEDIDAAKHLEDCMDSLSKAEIPDPERLKRVLEYTKIKSWTECHSQHTYLETETSSCGDSHITSLVSIMAFLKYCRVAIFKNIGYHRRTDVEDVSGNHINENFRCPISYAVMSDPVMLPSGQTYQRSAIEAWFRHSSKCPLTMQEMGDACMVPNIFLRNVIQQSQRKAKQPDGHKLLIGSQVALKTMELLLEVVLDRFKLGSAEEHTKLVFEIELMSRWNLHDRIWLIGKGIPIRLFSLLDAPAPASLTLKKNVFRAVFNLSKELDGVHEILLCGGLKYLAVEHNRGNRGITVVKRIAIATIGQLVSRIDDEKSKPGPRLPGKEVARYQGLLDENSSEIIQGLVDYFERAVDCEKINVLRVFMNYLRIIGCRFCPGLVGLAAHLVDMLRTTLEQESDFILVLKALNHAAFTEYGTMEVLRQSPLPNLIWVTKQASKPFLKDSCMKILSRLCQNSIACFEDETRRKEVAIAIKSDTELYDMVCDTWVDENLPDACRETAVALLGAVEYLTRPPNEG